MYNFYCIIPFPSVMPSQPLLHPGLIVLFVFLCTLLFFMVSSTYFFWKVICRRSLRPTVNNLFSKYFLLVLPHVFTSPGSLQTKLNWRSFGLFPWYDLGCKSPGRPACSCKSQTCCLPLVLCCPIPRELPFAVSFGGSDGEVLRQACFKPL